MNTTDDRRHSVETGSLDSGNTNETPDEPGPRSGPRVVYDEVTGYPVVTARPGARKVTNEDVRGMLEDFP
jgi:hypothetical protein